MLRRIRARSLLAFLGGEGCGGRRNGSQRPHMLSRAKLAALQDDRWKVDPRLIAFHFRLELQRLIRVVRHVAAHILDPASVVALDQPKRHVETGRKREPLTGYRG